MIKSKKLPTFNTDYIDRDDWDSLVFTYVFEPVTGKVIWAVKHYGHQTERAHELASLEVLYRGCELNIKTVANYILDKHHPCRSMAERFGLVPEIK